MIFFPSATSSLLLQWWCIFILYTQRTDCASFFSNAEPIAVAGLLSLCGESGETSEQYVSDKGSLSSVLLALRPEHGKASPATSCKRQFRAPDAFNFFVRMQRVPAIGSRSSASRKYNGNKSSNSTHSCPLTISQSANGEVLPSWRLDPCLLEASGTQEEPMRLLQGKLNIVWNHDGNAPNYRLQITVVGQGAVCLERGKHSCLEYVGMPLLCIARELVCDGLPNCPPVGAEVTDENEAMCVKHRQQEYSENPVQSVFRQYIQNTIKSFFGGEPKELPSKTAFGEVDIGLEQNFGSLYPAASSPFPPPATAEPTVPPKKHRSSLTGLSKYGPWGYLFLGMLICGGALLICGLWECCCRSHKPESNVEDSLPDQVPSFLQTSSPTAASRQSAQGDSPTGHNLPQYGELDPPPAYSVLFPAQKPSDNGNELPVTTETAQTNSPSVSDSNNSTEEHSRTADGESLVVATEVVPPVPV